MLLPYLNPDLIEAGCDEAGRGCLAGAVYAAAVILPKDFRNELLNDSAFDLATYIARRFGVRMGNAEERAFITGDGVGKPLGLFAASGGIVFGIKIKDQFFPGKIFERADFSVLVGQSEIRRRFSDSQQNIIFLSFNKAFGASKDSSNRQRL